MLMQHQEPAGVTESRKMQRAFDEFGREVLRLLEEFSGIQQKCEIKKPEIKKCIDEIGRAIDAGIVSVRETLRGLLENAEWETVNVGFFGETNAGKTTLIQALTRNDGRAIGDGRKDFTRHVGQVRLDNLNFFDMPGIEGNEDKVKNEIRLAVQKCHVVFYIYRGNKQPEEPTLKKIKAYLADFARVYSIMNISGKARSYKYNRRLVGDSEMQVERESVRAFRKTLEGHYDSNLMMQAHLAYLALGKPTREDLLKEREIALGLFGTGGDLLEYSRFSALHGCLSRISADGIREITVSNYYKLLRDIENILGQVLLAKREYDRAGKLMRSSLIAIRDELRKLVGSSKNRMKLSASGFFKELENKLVQAVFDGIDGRKSKEEMEKQLKGILRAAEHDLRTRIEEIAREIEKETNRLMEQFERSVRVDFQNSKLQTDFDLTAIVEQLKVSVRYVSGQLLDSIVSVLTAFFAGLPSGPLAIAILIMTAIRKSLDIFLWDPKKRRREARAETCRLISEQLNPVKEEVLEKIEQELRLLHSEVTGNLEAAFGFVDGLDRFTREMDQAIAGLYDAKVRIFTRLARFLFGDRIRLAHVDLELQEVLLIGRDIEDLDHLEVRVRTCHKSPSLRHFFEQVSHSMQDNVLVLKERDEFKKRTVGALKKRLDLPRITGASYEN